MADRVATWFWAPSSIGIHGNLWIDSIGSQIKLYKEAVELLTRVESKSLVLFDEFFADEFFHLTELKHTLLLTCWIRTGYFISSFHDFKRQILNHTLKGIIKDSQCEH